LAVVAAYFLNGQCCDGRHSRLFEVASFAGPDQFVQRLDLALKPRVVPPVPVLREGQRRRRLIEADAAIHGVLHGRVFVRQHCGEFLHVPPGRDVAVRR